MAEQSKTSNISNENFKPALKDLRNMPKTYSNAPVAKKLTGSFNAGLKDLRAVATKANQNPTAKSGK